jgi:hypothetical protein
MAQVIIERPRHGSRVRTKGKGYDRRTAKLGWEDAVKSERMKDRGGRTKHLNENLAPLRRFLASRVGRPWVKVHAEICVNLDRDSAVQDHVHDHLADYVTVNVIERDGELLRGDGWAVGRPLYSLFYVCPRTGILRRNRFPRQAIYANRWSGPRLLVVWVAADQALVRMGRQWRLTTFRKIPPHDPRGPYYFRDALQKREIDRHFAAACYGREVYAVSSHVASKVVIRRHVSSYPHTNVIH